LNEIGSSIERQFSALLSILIKVLWSFIQMRFKQLIALTYAITAAGLAIGLTSDYTRSLQEEYGKHLKAQKTVVPEVPQIQMSSVVTVLRPLTFGHKLSAADFKVTSWPADAVPDGALRTLDEVFGSEGDKYAKVDMAPGEVVMPTKISASGNGSALSLMLPPGMRAVTIQINEVRGVGGFVQPKDKVDIILTETKEEKDKPKAVSSRVILQNILILAMGQDVRRQTGEQPKIARSATVAVSLEDAQKLSLATTIGQISLALRNPQQETVAGMKELSLQDLDGKKSARKSGKMEVVVHRLSSGGGEAGTRIKQRFTY
jgi:Flp pilus assembly protein CpaB